MIPSLIRGSVLTESMTDAEAVNKLWRLRPKRLWNSERLIKE